MLFSWFFRLERSDFKICNGNELFVKLDKNGLILSSVLIFQNSEKEIQRVLTRLDHAQWIH